MIRLVIMVVVWVAAVALVSAFLAGVDRLRQRRHARLSTQDVADQPGEEHDDALKGVGGSS